MNGNMGMESGAGADTGDDRGAMIRQAAQQALTPQELQIVSQTVTPQFVQVMAKLFGDQAVMLLTPLVGMGQQSYGEAESMDQSQPVQQGGEFAAQGNEADVLSGFNASSAMAPKGFPEDEYPTPVRFGRL